MAVTKIHPIKSTLKKALDYIENPDKTDEKLFVSSYGCSYETADIEFQMLLDQAYQKGNNLAHHLIQSFAPGEATPELAHEIGVKLAKEMWGDRFEIIVSTHLDKEHLHCHFCFNSVSYLDGSKYNYSKSEQKRLRETSDRLCREYGLWHCSGVTSSGLKLW